MKPITLSHTNPLLDNFKTLHESKKPEAFSGFIYLWKCVPEDMFYLGSHKGKPDDEYRGSGARFKRVFEYYGITQFERIVLEYVEDESKIKEREQAWMNKFRAKTSARFYNIKNAVSSLAH